MSGWFPEIFESSNIHCEKIFSDESWLAPHPDPLLVLDVGDDLIPWTRRGGKYLWDDTRGSRWRSNAGLLWGLSSELRRVSSFFKSGFVFLVAFPLRWELIKSCSSLLSARE
jgi:hypothetical protein